MTRSSCGAGERLLDEKIEADLEYLSWEIWSELPISDADVLLVLVAGPITRFRKPGHSIYLL